MNISNLRTKILLYIIPTISVVLIILSIMEYINTSKILKKGYIDSQKQIETNLVNSINLADASFRMLESQIEILLEEKLKIFLLEYQKSGNNPSKMNLSVIQKKLGRDMDLFIINSESVIEFTTDLRANNLDFKKLGLQSAMNKIRLGKEIVHGRIKTNLVTGELGKWAYLPTPEERYILEIGYSSSQAGSIAQEIDPLHLAKNLKDITPLIQDISFFDMRGYNIGETDKKKPNRKIVALMDTIIQNKSLELPEQNGFIKKYLFVDLDKKSGVSKTGQIIELTYNMSFIRSELRYIAFKSFLIGFLSIFGISIIVFLLSSRIVRPINHFNQNLKNISQGDGDLTVEIKAAPIKELSEMAEGFNVFVRKIRQVITETKLIAEQMANSSIQMSIDHNAFSNTFSVDANSALTIKDKSYSINNSTELIYQNINQLQLSSNTLVDSIKTFLNGVETVVEKMDDNLKVNDAVLNSISKGEQSVQKINNAILLLEENASKMSNIVSIINEISDKIELLSLNASIESARAGDYGKGFAIVASEISRLAEKTAANTKEISKLIHGSVNEVHKSRKLLDFHVQITKQIFEGVTSIHQKSYDVYHFMKKQDEIQTVLNTTSNDLQDKMSKIEAEIFSQKGEMKEITDLTVFMNENIQKNLVITVNLTSNSDHLSQMSEKIKSLFNYFKV
ncbi:MAG: methyl-accepting chemotaxis protein [Leptospiraceae bacterium]|nr:methyl-accepting chemotaxis protein [Leptospiraceae bacterium]